MDYNMQIREFIIQNFLYGDGARLTDQTSLLEEGIIDSTGLLELVTFLEDQYQIRIDDDELVPANLDTIENVSTFLERKLPPTRSEKPEIQPKAM